MSIDPSFLIKCSGTVKINMLVKIIRWSLGILLGIVAYLYDDALWGPVPIALMNSYFGWPNGFLLLCIMYFASSFFACFYILKHYDVSPKKRRSTDLKKKLTTKKKTYAYKLLFAGKWVGVAISCFTLGAILTSVVIGRLQLFTDIDRKFMSLILSSLYVFLFLGFYGGLFEIAIRFGWLSAIVLFIGVVGVFELVQIKRKTS